MEPISFYNLPKADLDYLNAVGTIKNTHKNDILIHKGTQPLGLFFVLSGLFSLEAEADMDSNILISEGEVIGEMWFLESELPVFSVIALEESTILLVPYEKIIHKIDTAPSFAAHFYRALSIGLSQRLRRTTKYTLDFYAAPASPAEKIKRGYIPSGPVALLNDAGEPDFEYIQEKIRNLSAIEEIGAYSKYSEEDLKLAFENREQNLSVASLSPASFLLLSEILHSHHYSLSQKNFIHHAASFSAKEKEEILPEISIQKTVTLQIGNVIGMLTGLGDFRIDSSCLDKLRTILKLSKRNMKSCTVNPKEFIPEIELGLLRGMVSCFFNPGKWTRLSFIVILTPEDYFPEFAISLSPTESLTLASKDFCKLTREYIESAFPYLPLFQI